MLMKVKQLVGTQRLGDWTEFVFQNFMMLTGLLRFKVLEVNFQRIIKKREKEKWSKI